MKNSTAIKKHSEAALTKPLLPDDQLKKPADSKSSFKSAAELKKTEFQFEAPQAKAVSLAGDFTGWEKSPLKMSRTQDGLWSASVPLSPGHYAYRFIVDGNWCDDPRCGDRVANPFGGTNALLKVA